MTLLKKSRSRSVVSLNQKDLSGLSDATNYYRHYDSENCSFSFAGNLIGDCYLGFSKLIQTELRLYEKRDSFILQNKVLKGVVGSNGGNAVGDGVRKGFEEQVWLMGKVVGVVKGEFKMSNMPVIQQMALGVLTETGVVMNVSPILLENKHRQLVQALKKSAKNEKISLLNELTMKLKKTDHFGKKNGGDKGQAYVH